MVLEKTDRKLNYWCKLSLIDRKNKKHTSVAESKHWTSAKPVVDFTTSFANNEHHGKCSISGFSNENDREYQVLFFSDLEKNFEQKTLLGYFWVKREFDFFYNFFII